MTGELLAQAVDWEGEGAALAARLADRHAVVVTGRDARLAARVALGFGRAASASRRVAIADLAGELPELQSLVRGDDPHGVVDSFRYGVSLNKIARQVDERGMLFVMPTGSEPEVDAEILRNERWHRLASGFREVGALLLLVVPSNAEGADALEAMVDGVIVVGDGGWDAVEPARVLAAIGVPAPTPVTVPAQPAAEPAEPPRRRIPTPRVATPISNEDVEAAGANGRRALVLGGLLLAALGLWFVAGRPGLGRGDGGAPPADRATPPGDSATPAAAVADPSPRGAAGVAAGAPAPSESAVVAKVDSLRALLPSNPADSGRAVAHGVVLLATPDEGQALAKWAEVAMQLPGGTVSTLPGTGRGARYVVQAGAFRSPRQADSLLWRLRDSGVVAGDAARVVATPFALRLEAGVNRRAARAVADGYVQRQVAAYPLLQPDGTATIYVGAFEAPETAAPALAALKGRGITATLVYRTGRPF